MDEKKPAEKRTAEHTENEISGISLDDLFAGDETSAASVIKQKAPKRTPETDPPDISMLFDTSIPAAHPEKNGEALSKKEEPTAPQDTDPVAEPIVPADPSSAVEEEADAEEALLSLLQEEYPVQVQTDKDRPASAETATVEEKTEKSEKKEKTEKKQKIKAQKTETSGEVQFPSVIPERTDDTEAAEIADPTEEFILPLSRPTKGQRILGLLAVCAAVLLVGGSIFYHQSDLYQNALYLYINNAPVGYVSSVAAVQKQLSAVKTDLMAEGEALPFDLELSLRTERVHLPSAEMVLGEEELYRGLWDAMTASYVRGYTVWVEDTFLAYAADAADVTEALEAADARMESRMAGELSSLQNAALLRVTDVAFTPAWIPAEEISTAYELRSLFCGEGAGNISYAISYTETETVILPYDTIYVENDENFNGVDTLISTGRSGLAAVTSVLLRDCETGEILSSSESATEVIAEPVDRYAYYGNTPLLDESVCTGTFSWPLDTSYVISSLYGERDLWGEYDFHLGYDIAAPYRTEIYACDGGVVVFAGYSSSYGYVTRILHKDNVETLYAHQSSQAVKVGDIVEKGQCIGYVGSSGVTSGSHLHLEFRKDHVTCDPAEFIEIPAEVEIVIY